MPLSTPVLLDLPQDRSTAHTCDVFPPTRDAQPRIWVAKFSCVFKNEPLSQSSTFRLRFITWTEQVSGQLSGRVPQPGPSSHSGLHEDFWYCPPDLPSLPGEHSLVRRPPTILFLEGQRLSGLTYSACPEHWNLGGGAEQRDPSILVASITVTHPVQILFLNNARRAFLNSGFHKDILKVILENAWGTFYGMKTYESL